MYSWGDDMSDWRDPSGYRYDAALKSTRDADAARSTRGGPRTYCQRQAPDPEVVDPRPRRATQSPHSLVIAVDVTSSMAGWPAEIFDRLPLLYNTLAQYRPDLEIAFAAVGDVRAFEWPLQASGFGKGFELEKVLAGICPEGLWKSSIDPPESYGLLAYWANTRVSVPATADSPFLIVFGDISMHPKHTPAEIAKVFGDKVRGAVDSVKEWKKAAARWNTWFLLSHRCWEPEQTKKQWSRAVGADRILWIQDEQRAVDYAMGLVARTWGRLDDFLTNMKARQPGAKVRAIEHQISELRI